MSDHPNGFTCEDADDRISDLERALATTQQLDAAATEVVTRFDVWNEASFRRAPFDALYESITKLRGLVGLAEQEKEQP